LPTLKTKPTSKPSKKSARRFTPSTKPSKAAKPPPKKKLTYRKPSAAAKPRADAKTQPLDLSPFPPESTTILERWICLACVLDVFTRHLHLAPRAAHLEIKRYTPSLSEFYAPTARPWFINQPAQTFCPYCGSASKWHTRLSVYRIESGTVAIVHVTHGARKSLA
jgi:hypothetical protein